MGGSHEVSTQIDGVMETEASSFECDAQSQGNAQDLMNILRGERGHAWHSIHRNGHGKAPFNTRAVLLEESTL